MDSDPFKTQRDVGPAVVTELSAAGFADAEEIGRGGFGIVFRCTQAALDRVVAVKVLTAELREERERFVREQRAMAQLTGHPNIVGVLQVGETASGYPYLVMQYHRQGSLSARIKRLGVLPVEEVLRLGVRMAGALHSAHNLGILHRDIKPANILLTDYGEPALSDFGIAHIAGGFQTAAGTFTGSPAFTAPEILSGDPPSEASDVYGLGATLFAALTGHAAFERHKGEQVVAQFLRIASEPVPDLRGGGIPDDVSAAIERAMSREPADRPAVIALGEELRRVQSAHGFPVDEMALRGAEQVPGAGQREAERLAPVRRAHGGLPLELTSFIGREAELGVVRDVLSTSRLVTLTGVGGVGKTRLARRAAAEAQHDFPDGVRLVELGELHEGSLLPDVVAAGLGLRDEAARPLRDLLVDFLSARRLLLVLDNCEQLIDEVGKLVEELLRECPYLRILATSRERLGVSSESVVPVAPLACPDADKAPTLGSLARFDAVALFSERAAAAVRGFRLTDDNKTAVASIVSRLEGVPLAIELGAARLRAMSLEQLRERLADRYKVLTLGSRGAPKRQQTLSWSVGWSYDLCTEAEQLLWGRLSVFAGIFELEEAQHVCGADMAEYEFLDLVTSLVDKSILMRTESDNVVRFRLLETLREYGRQQIEQTAEYRQLRRRHADWYRQLARDAFDAWFGPRQLEWLARIQREMPNIREALEFSLSEDGEAALAIVAALQPFWMCRGMLREARQWTDRTLARAPREPTRDRVQALFSSVLVAPLYGDVSAGAARAAEARVLAEKTDDPVAHAGVAMAEGVTALMSADFTGAAAHLKDALRASDDENVQVNAMLLLGWALEFAGDSGALAWQQKALDLATSRGESVYRSFALWELGINCWQHGQPDRAERLLREGLGFARLIDDRRNAAGCLEGLAWIAAQKNNPKDAAVMMGAADALARAIGSVTVPALPRLHVFHAECESRSREALGGAEFGAARQQGGAMSFDEAVAYALSDDPEPT